MFVVGFFCLYIKLREKAGHSEWWHLTSLDIVMCDRALLSWRWLNISPMINGKKFLALLCFPWAHSFCITCKTVFISSQESSHFYSRAEWVSEWVAMWCLVAGLGLNCIFQMQIQVFIIAIENHIYICIERNSTRRGCSHFFHVLNKTQSYATYCITREKVTSVLINLIEVES